MTKMQSQHVMLVVSNVDKTIYQITYLFVRIKISCNTLQ